MKDLEKDLSSLKNAWHSKNTANGSNSSFESSTKRNVGNFLIYYNEGRVRHITNPQAKNNKYFLEHSAFDDVFCRKKDEVWQKQCIGSFDLTNYSWDILVNNSAIDEFHSLVIPKEQHVNQHITLDFLNDLLELSNVYRDLSIAVNSWGAGASQNHFHAHLFFSTLPIAELELIEVVKKNGVQILSPMEYPVDIYVFEGNSRDNICEAANEVIQKLIKNQIPYNVLFFDGKIFLAPRGQEFDDSGIKRGVDSIFGYLPITSQELFNNLNLNDIHQILEQIGFNSKVNNINILSTLFSTRPKQD